MNRNIAGLIRTFLTLLFAFIKQKRFVNAELGKLIRACYLRNDGTLPQTKKILFNYSTLVPAILGEAFCALRGSKISKLQRKASTLQSAFSVLGDDFFDNDLLPESKFERLFTDIENLTPSTSSEELFGILYLKFLDVNKNDDFEYYFRQIYKAEKESRIQENPNASIDEIKRVTQQKGAYSLLFFRTAFENSICENEQKLLFKLGECVQLANDAFDIYKDYNAGVHTLVTKCKDFNKMIKYYIELIDEVRQLAYQLEKPERNIAKFLQIMSLSVFSRTLACFNKLQTNQKQTGGQFKISEYTRKQLVVDMENPKNLLKMLQYFLKMEYTKKGA